MASGLRVLVDLTGRVFGRLTVVSRVHKQPKRTHWLCRCSCGSEVVVWAGNLPSGKTLSCGCLRRERTGEANAIRIKHGHSAGVDGGRRIVSATYRSWKAMLERCRNPNAPNYRLYGGRGITICAQWQGDDGFTTFLADMGERPEGKTLDRVDVNGHYEPGNARWATPKEQAQNRRHTPELDAIRREALARGRSATNAKRQAAAKASRASRS